MIDLYVSGGVLAFYRGFPLHFICESLGNGAYLLTYHTTKRSLMPSDGGAPSMSSRIICGALAGIFGWVTIYPFDVLRSRIISTSIDGDGLSPLRAAQLCYREGGVAAFYRGIRMTLLRAAPVAGVVLPVYDAVNHVLM